MVRGKIKPETNEEKQKELLEPTTMLFGELAEKNGYCKLVVFILNFKKTSEWKSAPYDQILF